MKKKLLLVMSVLLGAFVWTSVQFAESPTNSHEKFSSVKEENSSRTFDKSDDRTDCVSAKAQWQDNTCTTKALRVHVTNNCSESVDIQTCIENEDGYWSCGQDNYVRPGATPYGGFYSCSNPTGRYKWWARKAGSNSPFPNPNRP